MAGLQSALDKLSIFPVKIWKTIGHVYFLTMAPCNRGLSTQGVPAEIPASPFCPAFLHVAYRIWLGTGCADLTKGPVNIVVTALFKISGAMAYSSLMTLPLILLSHPSLLPPTVLSVTLVILPSRVHRIFCPSLGTVPGLDI